MNAQEERDLAAEARHGGQMFCHWPHARVWTPDTLQLAARILVAGSSRAAALPESAFDWQIYRAAAPGDCVMSTYPALWTYDGMDEPDLLAHSRQEVTILSQLGPADVDPEVDPMFRVRFADGFEADAFLDELLCLHDGKEDASDCIVHIADTLP